MVSTWLHTVRAVRDRLGSTAVRTGVARVGGRTDGRVGVRTGVACAMACGIIVLVYGCSARSVQLIVLFILLAHAAFVDRCRLVIPNEIVLAIVSLRVTFAVFELAVGMGIEPVVQGLVAALIVLVPTLALALVFETLRGSSAFGGGDIKLLFATSLHFSWYTALFGVFFACMIGAGVGILRAVRVARGSILDTGTAPVSNLAGEEAKRDAHAFSFAPAIAWGFFLACL